METRDIKEVTGEVFTSQGMIASIAKRQRVPNIKENTFEQ